MSRKAPVAGCVTPWLPLPWTRRLGHYSSCSLLHRDGYGRAGCFVLVNTASYVGCRWMSTGRRQAVCSTSNEKAVTNLVKTLMGKDRLDRIKIFAGDVVARKKPNPDIYNLAKVGPTA